MDEAEVDESYPTLEGTLGMNATPGAVMAAW
jgi:hypothetical protein